MTARVLSLGEALIDVVIRPESTQEHVGGSLLNVAVGIATLGLPASICAHLGKDTRGELLTKWADSAGVDIVAGTDSAEQTSVVVTRGPWGAYALLANNRDMLHLDQMAVAVGDTVGAGDSFMAGLVSGLLDAGFLGSADARRRLRDVDWSAVQPALHRAVVTSALTVSRSGAYAPTMAEVLVAQEADPSLK